VIASYTTLKSRTFTRTSKKKPKTKEADNADDIDDQGEEIDLDDVDMTIAAGNTEIIVREGNFVGASRQMEHNGLIKCLNQISNVLINHAVTLDLVVDGDLSIKKTLGDSAFVSKVYIDLQHKAKNIRKRVSKYLEILKQVHSSRNTSTIILLADWEDLVCRHFNNVKRQ
jgi:hypothetical protein